LSKQGAKGEKGTVGRRKACVYWLLRRLDSFGAPQKRQAASNKSVVHDAQTHIFVILRACDESEIPPPAGGGGFIPYQPSKSEPAAMAHSINRKYRATAFRVPTSVGSA
jgi:hypothetical protein